MNNNNNNNNNRGGGGEGEEEDKNEKRMHTEFRIGMLFFELMGILRPTIQRIITEVIQDACVLSTFYVN